MRNRALILAAGRGSRMGSVTALKPKCLTLLAGKALLDWQIESLTKAGISEISIVTGYKSNLIDKKLNKYHNNRWNETNMVSSLFCAESFDGDTIISYSDIVYNEKHISKLYQSQNDIVIVADKEWLRLWRLRFDDPLEDAESFNYVDNKLQHIGGKAEHVDDIFAQYMGLIKVSKNGWNQIKTVFNSLEKRKRDKIDMTSILNLLIMKNININVIFVNGGWCEADTYSDIIKYENQLKQKNNWVHDWR